MTIGATGGVASLGLHLQIHGAASQGAAQSKGPSQTQSGSQIDRDGDHDNSTALSDAAEGKGSVVNLVA